MPVSAAVLTAEYKVNFLSPAEGKKLVARGHVLKPGRILTVCFGEVHAKKDGKEKLVATMLATMTAREQTSLAD
jgi:acyl-coenzyme A thioesterase PaaI-like protein